MARRSPNNLLCAVLACFAGAAFTGGVASALPKKFSPYHKLNIFTRVLSYVENNYVEDVDQDKLVYGAIKGMLATLDPHSSLHGPDAVQGDEGGDPGQFGGVGLEVEMRDGDPHRDVARSRARRPPRRGSPTGDQILRIDGADHARHDHGRRRRRACAARRAPRSRSSSVARPGPSRKPLHAGPRRDPRRERDPRTLEPGYGLVRVKQFQENTERDLEQALDKLDKDAPGGKVRGLVLDLRNNPGGLLDQAVRVADLFIDSRADRAHRGQRRPRHRGGEGAPPGHAHGLPDRSASSTAARPRPRRSSPARCRTTARAVIMGTQTFGKGSVQTVIELDDGSALKLTIARYFTPSGRSIQEHGITPDVVVEQVNLADLKPDHGDEPDKKERDLAGHLKNNQHPRRSSRARQRTPSGDDSSSRPRSTSSRPPRFSRRWQAPTPEHAESVAGR